MASDLEPGNARRRLTLFDATCIMVGIVVGSGIFGTPASVAKVSPSTLVFFSIWIAGGIASLLGALCFAELSTRYPEDGGSYAFLHRAFGPWASFLFAWTDFWIVRPGNVGAVAFVLGGYAQAAMPLPGGRLAYAIAAVVVSTGVHLAGLHAGRWSQNVMSIAKVGGLMLVVLAAFTGIPAVDSDQADATIGTSSLLQWSQAWVLVMFCYGGWSDLSNVAAEVREPSRNMLRALVLGIVAITVLYLAVNAAAVYSLGLRDLGESKAMAADVVETRFSSVDSDRDASVLVPWAKEFVGLLVAICCLSSLSGVIFVGARVYYALGLRHRAFAWLGEWDFRRNTPPQSLVAQGVISCILLLVAGQTDEGFDRLVILAGPCYWGFTLLATLALIVLRRRDMKTPLPFRVPFYPVTPILFALVCGVLVASSVYYIADKLAIEAWYSLGVIAAGIVVAAKWGRRPR